MSKEKSPANGETPIDKEVLKTLNRLYYGRGDISRTEYNDLVNSLSKDNPVPSLYKLLADEVGAESVEYEQICSIINGVENTNEQPIITDLQTVKHDNKPYDTYFIMSDGSKKECPYYDTWVIKNNTVLLIAHHAYHVYDIYGNCLIELYE